MVTEKKTQKTLKPELVQAIKDFLSTGMPVTEVSQKLNVPYHTVYHYSPLNKKRLARVKRQKATGKLAPKKVTAKSIIGAKIEELVAERDKLQLQIDTLTSLL